MSRKFPFPIILMMGNYESAIISGESCVIRDGSYMTTKLRYEKFGNKFSIREKEEKAWIRK